VRRQTASSAPPFKPAELLLATAKIDHSGRVGDRVLLTALGWNPGDRHDVRTIRQGAELSLSPTGLFRVDSRSNVFLPAATRDLLGIHPGDRVVLIASPTTDTLLIHPVTVVTALLTQFHRYPAGDSGEE
jgi:bifunctional DNA-binding transcriptional regulator/antitoxin component of YhaV-PrlF toxin-antitoxin module